MQSTAPWARRPLSAAALAQRRLQRCSAGAAARPGRCSLPHAAAHTSRRRHRASARSALTTGSNRHRDHHKPSHRRPEDADRQEHSAAEQSQALRFPDWMPQQISEIQEPAALQLAAAMVRRPVDVPPMGRSVDTAFVGPDSWPTAPADAAAPPFLLVPSFDGSSLEHRRLYPLLAAHRRAFAVDVVGWGFSDATFASDPATQLGPQQKREHLHAFVQQQVRQPAVVVGTSIGGTIALDFALSHPEDVAALVLIDAQGFIDGIGPMASLPRWAARLGVKVLGTQWLRQRANQMAYVDPALASRDAMLVGRLSTHMPGWEDANLAFMASGGYKGIGAQVPNVKPPVLVLWGRQDRILPPSTAQQFADALPDATITYLENSGHSGHLEEPAATAAAILDFVGSCATTQP